MHERAGESWSQVVFDGSEAVQDALHCQAGCEAALYTVLDQLGLRPEDQTTVFALVNSITKWREIAQGEIRIVQQTSFGH